MRKALPKVGKRVSTPAGNGKVVELDVLARRCASGSTRAAREIFPADVITVPRRPRSWSGWQAPGGFRTESEFWYSQG